MFDTNIRKRHENTKLHKNYAATTTVFVLFRIFVEFVISYIMQIMNPNPTDRFTKIYLTIWGICLFVALVGLILFRSGYRLTNKLALVHVGAIEITSEQSDFKIFLNNIEQKPILSNEHFLISNVTPGIYSIILSKENFWPWTKTFTVLEKETYHIYSFMLPEGGIETKTIPLNTPEHISVSQKFWTSSLPSILPYSPARKDTETIKTWLDRYAPSRKISTDGTEALYVDNNTIYLAWLPASSTPPSYFCPETKCVSQVPILVSVDEIKNADFYKDRNDVVIFSAGLNIYALEADGVGTQNFQPLFRGNNPYFFKNTPNELYIKDGTKLLKASL